ncbi:MAG: gamma-glutamyltransferase [Saprospiraceae bacterium]|nr:gamma-glutamyltransferase [Saprospiraceae bacterium]
MWKHRLFVVSVLCLLLATSCQESSSALYEIRKTAFSKEGMVVSAHPLATAAGVEILRAGGNAIDAAVAVQLALAVVYPRAGNIGGGGFLVYRGADGFAETLDYREKAPLAATRDMYLDSLGNVIPGLSTRGHLAAGVPGTIAGLAASHEKYGSLDWHRLAEAAIRLAQEGFQVTAAEADRLNRYAEDIRAFNPSEVPFLQTAPWKEGDLLVQKELAQTLRRIADSGRDGFYQGETARLIVAEMQRGGGLITLEDLAGYQAKWRTPVTTDYKDYRLISMPPPSSGGIALAQLLEMVEPFPLSEWGFQDTRSVHLMVEAERRVYADRALHLGDMDFYPVPIDTLLDPEYLAERMADFDARVATTSQTVQAGDFSLTLESFETTHLTVVDAQGNAASVTTTLNSNYGCKVVVDGAGFFLNNEMDDFSAKPGVPNQFGLVGAEANAIAPAKRMLSSMTPTIIERDGRLAMTIGTPGGSTIITSVFQVFLNVAEFGMTIGEAVQAPRFHHQWLPDEIMLEPAAIEPGARQELSAKGHTFREVSYIGMVEAIALLPDGTLEGAADSRGDDHAQGL